MDITQLNAEEQKFLALHNRMEKFSKLFPGLPLVHIYKNMVSNRLQLSVNWPDDSMRCFTMPSEWYYEDIDPETNRYIDYNKNDMRRLETMMENRKSTLKFLEDGYLDKDEMNEFFTAYRLHRKAISGSGERDIYDVVLFRTENDFNEWHKGQIVSYHLEKTKKGKKWSFDQQSSEIILVNKNGHDECVHYYLGLRPSWV